MRTLRLTALPMRRWARDYPALTTLVALLLVCLIPFFQYRAWLVEGLRLGNIAFGQGQNAFESGNFVEANGSFREALNNYRRPWFYDQVEANRTELNLGQTYLMLSRQHKDSFYLLSAMEIYRHLSHVQNYTLEGLAGMTALREFAPRNLVKNELDNEVARYSEATLAKEPNNEELRAEAAGFYYQLANTHALLGDPDKLTEAYNQALKLAPQIVTLRIVGEIQDYQGNPLANSNIRVFNQQVTADAAGHFDISIKSLPTGHVLIEIEASDQPFYHAKILDITMGTTDYSVSATLTPNTAYINSLYLRADQLALSGNTTGAATLFAQAARFAVATDDAYLNNQVCWIGSVDRMAKSVLPACERAVVLAPDDSNIRDSRGLGRALTGDYPGAIEDFSYFAQYSSQSDRVQQRRDWIAMLEAGRNPFDKATLRLLHNQ